MPLKAILEDLDSVEEHLRDLYVEKDGKYHLDLDDTIRTHPAVVPLENSLRNSKKERDAARKDLNELKAKYENVPDDFDPEELERLRTEALAREDDPDGKDVRKQIDTAVAAARTQEQNKATANAKKLQDQLDAEKAQREGLESQLRNRIVEDELGKALLENGVTQPPAVKGAKSILANQIEVVEEDGALVARMKSDFGGDEISKYLAGWVQSDEGKFYADKPQGGDAPGSNRHRSNEANPFTKQAWSKTAQGQLLNSDRAKAERLAKSAGFRDLEAAVRASAPPVAA